jgi:hypothetical protein
MISASVLSNVLIDNIMNIPQADISQKPNRAQYSKKRKADGLGQYRLSQTEKSKYK